MQTALFRAARAGVSRAELDKNPCIRFPEGFDLEPVEQSRDPEKVLRSAYGARVDPAYGAYPLNAHLRFTIR